ncbi:BhlA/UviB family holin-like peptide [Bacillus cereus]|uniref:BhlA/UviB family holin-like peptide n=1 Tax=Bacillus cereus TaxID=1396 RepID=UPI000BF43432|nr:BhlA/UviB family holin-like peptide [Bacillus cereus]PER82224.1 bacteriocin biosynthesis protein [Bacillus cereus]
MEQEIFKIFLQKGSWAMLARRLLWTNNKRNEQREDKYQVFIRKNQKVIEVLAKAFGSISKDITEIKQKNFEGDDK